MYEQNPPPRRRSTRRRRRRRIRWTLPVLIAAVVVCFGLLISPWTSPSREAPPNVVAALDTPFLPSPTPIPVPTPTSAPTPIPYNYAAPAPTSAPVELNYFADAVFIGDSRTDGLRLYSGIHGTTFFCYKGITVFDIMGRPEKRVIPIGDKKYNVLEALALQPYAKVYISLGVNELGYNNNQGFEDTFGTFLDEVHRLQPDAIVYLQNLAPVNPEKCLEKKQPTWANNTHVAQYNEIYARLAQDKQVILLDVASALAGEDGALPPEGTVDGIHFTKPWYQAWLAYLLVHTVAPF